MKKAWLWTGAGGLALGLSVAGALHLVARDAPPELSATLAAESPARSDAAPFTVGETLAYDVGWTLLNAGTLTLSLADDPGGRGRRITGAAKVADALAGLYPLEYQAETLVDGRSLLPRRATVRQREGRRQRTRITVFDHAARRAHFEQVGGRQADVSIPADAHDMLSALYALRARRTLTPGARLSLSVCDSGRLYTALLSVGGSENVDTPAGRFDAYRLTPVVRNAAGQTEKLGVTLWLTSDARRLPVRLEVELAVGRFVIALRSITPA